MKIKMIKDIKKRNGWIRKGEELEVRIFPKLPFQLNPDYQIIDGVHSGEVIPTEFCIGLPKEKTYSEKEWNDMENYYMDKLEKERQKSVDLSKKAKVPSEVAKALDRLKSGWSKISDQENINLILLNCISLARAGDLLILKNFAMNNPTTYIQALANGYEAITVEEQVYKMVDDWLNTPYEGDSERADIEAFSVRLVDLVKKQL